MVPGPSTYGIALSSSIEYVKVQISVVLGQSVMSMQHLLRMSRGAIIELDSHQDDPVRILAKGKAVAKGEIQVAGDKFAILVTELLAAQ